MTKIWTNQFRKQTQIVRSESETLLSNICNFSRTNDGRTRHTVRVRVIRSLVIFKVSWAS